MGNWFTPSPGSFAVNDQIMAAPVPGMYLPGNAVGPTYSSGGYAPLQTIPAGLVPGATSTTGGYMDGAGGGGGGGSALLPVVILLVMFVVGYVWLDKVHWG